VLSRRVLTRLLGVDALTVRVDSVDVVDDEVVVWLRPRSKLRSRCPTCGARCPGYDPGRPRRWRALDFGRTKVFVAYQPPRVECPQHGVAVSAVPWARPGARHTCGFEQLAAWCAVEMSSSAASRLLRCSWRTIGQMVTRVAADMRAGDDGLDGLRRVGMDEISYRRGHRYLFVVVDHDRRRLVWAADRANQASVHAFFDALGPVRTAQLTHISADGAKWLADVITARAPDAVVCADSFHVVRWAMDALDEVRRHTWNQVRVHRGPNKPAIGEGKKVWDAKWALWKNPDRHSDAERGRLAYIAATHPRLHRAWALKEGLRTVFSLRGEAAIAALDAWISWARRCRLPSFVKVAKRVTGYRAEIVATLTHGLTNALVESVNTKIRLITRRAFGFRNVNALIALAQLSLGGYRPELPT
jgi:transposase